MAIPTTSSSGVKYIGHWQFCTWGHGWYDDRKQPSCDLCDPTKPECPMKTKRGSRCLGTPIEETGFCMAHSRQIAVHVGELASVNH